MKNIKERVWQLLEVGEIILTCSDIIMHIDFYMKMSVVQHKNDLKPLSLSPLTTADFV